MLLQQTGSPAKRVRLNWCYDVRFWETKRLVNGTGARFRVRWAVDGRELTARPTSLRTAPRGGVAAAQLPGCRSPAAPGTASPSCQRSTPLHRRASASPTPSAPPSPSLAPAVKETTAASRQPEVAGQRRERHGTVSVTAPAPAVRGPSVDFKGHQPGGHGRIADGGGPDSCLETHKRWSAGGTSGGASGL